MVFTRSREFEVLPGTSGHDGERARCNRRAARCATRTRYPVHASEKWRRRCEHGSSWDTIVVQADL